MPCAIASASALTRAVDADVMPAGVVAGVAGVFVGAAVVAAGVAVEFGASSFEEPQPATTSVRPLSSAAEA
jgi:hypothetical protein